MSDMREGCAASVAALARDGALFTNETGATDPFWTLLSIPTRERLMRHCGWTQECHTSQIIRLARLAMIERP